MPCLLALDSSLNNYSMIFVLVHLQYKSWQPIGRAIFHFQSQSEAREASDKFSNVEVSGHPWQQNFQWSEGTPRHANVSGTGPGAGIKERGTTVVLEGFPDFVQKKHLKDVLTRERFKLRDDPEQAIERIPL